MTDIGELLFAADRADPYPAYDEGRRAGIERSVFGPWFATTHDACHSILRDQRFRADPNAIPGYEPPAPTYFAEGKAIPPDSLLSLDPPDHTRVRRLVSHAFTPRAIAQLREFTETVTASLIDDVRGAGTVDLIDAFAFPIPLAVICRVLGVPVADRNKFRQWGEDLVPLLDPIITEEARAIARKADIELTAYLDALIDDKRTTRAEDLLSELIRVEEEGDRLSPDELLSVASLILGAGFETTVNLIGNGTLALLRHPDQLAKLRADPALVRGGVDELLRFDSPVQLTARLVAQEIDAFGETLAAGDEVIVVLGAANRDPAAFADPGVLDVSRANASDHLAFSSATHFCLGASLARMEGEIAFGQLMAHDLALAGEPVWRETIVMHGVHSLPLSVAP